MLRRLALATLCGLCLSGITYAQRVASRNAPASERQAREDAVRSAADRYFEARQSGNEAQRREAFDRLRDAYDAARGAKSMPDLDGGHVRGSREVERSQGWDRRMEGPSRGGGGRPDGGGRHRDRDTADRGGRADRSSGADRGGRDKSSGREGPSGGSDRRGGARDNR
jgi:hypothetical protein